MSLSTIWRIGGSCFSARVVWSLTAGLMPAGGSAPLLACDDGIAVPDPANNPGLVADCHALLAARDKLAGNDPLNWDVEFVVEAWRGITVSGSPRRVTKLSISPLDISGEVPAELGQLSELTELFLPGNLLNTDGRRPDRSDLGRPGRPDLRLPIPASGCDRNLDRLGPDRRSGDDAEGGGRRDDRMDADRFFPRCCLLSD